MKHRTLRYKISRKTVQRAAFPIIKRKSSAVGAKVHKPPKVVKVSIESEGDDRIPDAVNRVVTIGFSAIRNLKEILARLNNDRSQLMKYLNEYIAAVSEIVEGMGGVTEKFQGNGILFAFGAAGSKSGDITNAVLASLKIRYRMNKLNRSWNLYHDEAWKVGVGLTTGTTLVMRQGPPRKCTYSLRGNVPEFARGLGCSAAHAQIIITEEMYKMKNFPKNLFETKKPFHIQAHGTDYMTRVREVVAMTKEKNLI